MPADASQKPRIARRRRPRRHAGGSITPGAAVLPYLRLVRAPAVFSALGDPLAGLLLDGEVPPPGPAARLSAASAMLYLAGMALNDLADREEDARERPERPIPSGAVSPRAAALVGGSLLLAGTLVARRCGARWTGPALAATIVGYDFFLKRSATIGPVAMGACRSLSLLMGVEASQGEITRRGTEGALLLSQLFGGQRGAERAVGSARAG